MPPKKIKQIVKAQPEDFVEEKPQKQKRPIQAEPARRTKIKLELGDGIFNSQFVHISSWNINGLRASTKNASTTKYLNSGKVTTFQFQFDIICLNELKVDEDTFLKENLQSKFSKEYFQYMNCCSTKAGYSGVGILSKVKPISIKYDIGIDKHDGEGRAVTAEYERFFLVASYVPNAGQKLERLDYRTKEWDIDFRQYLNDLRKRKPTILCGDLNVAHEEIDLANPKTNTKTAGYTIQEREQFSAYLASGWIDTFRHLKPTEQKYSYFSARFNSRQNNKGWRLDYFVINKESIAAVENSDINTEIEGSDHVPIELTLNLQKL